MPMQALKIIHTCISHQTFIVLNFLFGRMLLSGLSGIMSLMSAINEFALMHQPQVQQSDSNLPAADVAMPL